MRFILFGLLLQGLVFAQTFIKEYTYNAGENDSKVSARNAALAQIKRLVIEEVGVNVRSSYFKQIKDDNNKISRNISDKLELFSQGVTQTTILEERWNGEQFYLKAKVVIDPDKIAQGFDRLQAKRSPQDICKERAETVKKKLYDLSTQEKLDRFTKFAVNYPFDDCNKWHHKVIYLFSKNELNPKRYRHFLLQTLENIENPSMDNRADMIIEYLTSSLTKEELKIVLHSVQKMQIETFNETMQILASEKNPIAKDTFEQLFQMAFKRELGRPVPFTKELATSSMLAALEDNNSPYFASSYKEAQPMLSLRIQSIFYKKLKNRFLQDPKAEYFDAIEGYLKQLEPSKRTADTIFSFYLACERKAKKEKRYEHYLQRFREELKDEVCQNEMPSYASLNSNTYTDICE